MRAYDSVLQELDRCWDSIALHTSWQLTPLVQYIRVEKVDGSHPQVLCPNDTVEHNRKASPTECLEQSSTDVTSLQPGLLSEDVLSKSHT